MATLRFTFDVCRLYGSLKNYGDYVCAREERTNEMLPKDPRSEEDRLLCQQLCKANLEKLQKGKAYLSFTCENGIHSVIEMLDSQVEMFAN